ncbi:MAG TPA: aminoacetone oxidase family FAD-binding enzyme, partial [Elusimicrobiales bacterium]|nr:aminoacetone oxidase family FAD-binding enzyme [Elusimicrobiales bacterium]
MPKRHVIIVGAGASGLAAACAAAEAGAQVTVLEKNHVPGRKILSTGAGKCNFTNASVAPDRYHGGCAGFLDRVFSACPPERVRGFFDELGLLSAADGEGRVFPRSMKAADVANSLLNRMSERGAALRVLTEVTGAERGPGGFTVSAVKVRPKWEKGGAQRGEPVSFSCDSLILACGGPAYPQIGGSDSGYALARSLGHTAEPPRPALVPLKVRHSFVKQAAGVRLQTAAELVSGGNVLARSRGETLFTEYGVSGPAALELSRTAVFALGTAPAFLRLDLFPEYAGEALDALLSRRRE